LFETILTSSEKGNSSILLIYEKTVRNVNQIIETIK